MPYLIVVSIIWGFSFVIIKGSLTSLDSNFVSFARLLLSFVVFLPFARLKGIQWLDRLRLALIGGVQFGLMYVAYVAAFRYLPAHGIALMTTTTPLFVTVFGNFHEKKPRKAFLVSALLAVAGGAVIAYPDQPLSASMTGIALVQISNAAFAFGQIAYRRLMASRPVLRDKSVFGLMYGGAVIAAGLFTLSATDYGQLTVKPPQWMALAYLGIVASGLCFFLWNLGARGVDEGALAVMNNMKIPVGVVASLSILGETSDYPKLIAGCALFAGALWANERLRR
jgi:drug/metabolite transporter (DMT)-like permease